MQPLCFRFFFYIFFCHPYNNCVINKPQISTTREAVESNKPSFAFDDKEIKEMAMEINMGEQEYISDTEADQCNLFAENIGDLTMALHCYTKKKQVSAETREPENVIGICIEGQSDQEYANENEAEIDTMNEEESANIHDNNKIIEKLQEIIKKQENEMIVRSKNSKMELQKTRVELKNSKNELRKKEEIIHKKNEQIDMLSSKNESYYINEIKNKLSDEFVDLFENQLKNQTRPDKGRRYSQEIKQFALSIYYLSPAAFEHLRPILILPSYPVLMRYTQNWPSKPGLNLAYFKTLAMRLSQLPDIAKHCTICIDEMSIKKCLRYDPYDGEIIGLEDNGSKKENKLAQYALVVMAHGISHNWKQPLGYVFTQKPCSAKNVKHLLVDAVRNLLNEGITPHAVITDQGSNFISLFKSLGLTTSKTTFSIEGHTLCYIFDPPHLIKSVRNNLMKHDFYFGEPEEQKVAKWEVLKDFYEYHNKGNFRMVHKLKKEHVYPDGFQKMRVKLATQVFSKTCAAALKTYYSISNGKHNEINTTATFFEMWDGIFDMFNSSWILETQKPNKKPFAGTPEQFKLLEEFEEFIRSIVVKEKETGKDVTKSIKCLQNWIVTISSLKHLWNVLSEKGFEYILTRRLNQDCLENHFGYIRKQGGNSRNPTAKQFQSAFKKNFGSMFLKVVRNGNCEDQQAYILPLLRNYIFPCHFNGSQNIEPLKLTLPTDFRNMSLVERNAFVYFTGYLVKKCKDKHQCSQLICGENDIATIYTNFKRYENCELQIPVTNFIKYVERLEDEFFDNFDPTCKAIQQDLFDKLNAVQEYACCEHFNKEYLINLFIRVRIYYILKFNNSEIKEDPKRAKCLSIFHL